MENFFKNDPIYHFLEIRKRESPQKGEPYCHELICSELQANMPPACSGLLCRGGVAVVYPHIELYQFLSVVTHRALRVAG